MVDRILEFPERTRLQILAPVVTGKKGEHIKIFEKLQREGYFRIRVNGEMQEVTDEIELDKNKEHSIEVVVDSIIVKEGVEVRLCDSIETVLSLGEGIIFYDVIGEVASILSEKLAGTR